MPTQDEVLGYFDTLSNWGRWGDDDMDAFWGPPGDGIPALTTPSQAAR